MITGTFNEFDSEMKPMDFVALCGDVIKTVEFTYNGGRISLVVNGVEVKLPVGSSDFFFTLDAN
jgi:hypothetical protein